MAEVELNKIERGLLPIQGVCETISNQSIKIAEDIHGGMKVQKAFSHCFPHQKLIFA